MNKIVRLATTATLALTITLGTAVAASAATPAPSSPVLDGGQMLSTSQESALVNSIRGNDDRYGLAFVVETIPSLNGRDIAQLALQRAKALGVGDARLNNGVYTLISRDDHKIQIELGSGVSPKVSDSTVEQIIADDMTPAFRQEQYEQGIAKGLNDLGMTYATGVQPGAAEAQAQKDAQQAQDAQFQQGLAGFWHVVVIVLIWIGILLGSALVIGAIVMVILSIRDRAINRRVTRRKVSVAELFREIQNLDDDEGREFLALPNDDARQKWLAPRMEDHLVKDADFAQILYERSVSEYVKWMLSQIEKDLDMRWASVYRTNVGNIALGAAFSKFRADSETEKVRQQEQAKADLIRLEKKREEQRVAAAERARIEAQTKAEAKEFWDGLSAEQKAKVKSARTKSDKRKVLADYGVSSGDFALWLPVWLAVYAGEVGAPQSDYSSSSHSSSSSSSSSYSSSSDFGSSFGGGSFDGGGGGGSW